MAISSVLVSFLLLWGLTAITEVSPIVQFLVALIGLGLAIDYALLIVVRWREERERGLEGDEAVIAAMGTAGRAVVFSGTTVAVGLLALVVLPLPFLRSMGYGGMLIPLVATSVAITLLPVILATVGPRMDRRRLRRRDNSLAFWQRWSEAVVRRRWVAAIVSIAVLVALAGAATNLHLGNADPDTIAKAGPAKQGLDALAALGHRQGRDRAGRDARPREPTRRRWPRAQARVDGRPRRRGAGAPPTGAATGSAVVAAVPRQGDESQAGRDAVQDLRDAAHAASAQARVGGSGPLNADFIDAVYGSLPADDRRDLDPHLRAARARVPLAAAAGQGDRAQRPVDRRRLGHHGARLAAGPRLRRDLGHRRDRLDRVVDPAHRLRLPLRPLDGLRGLHPRPRARGVRQDQGHRRGDRLRARPHRAGWSPARR